MSGVCTGTTWDPNFSLAGGVYTNGNLSVANPSGVTVNARTTIGKTSGKYYWELTATGSDGTTDAGGVGIVEAIMPATASYIGAENSGLSWGYGSCCFSTYFTTWPGVSVLASPPAGSEVVAGLVHMFALDLDTGRFWAGQNGVFYGAGNPANGVRPVATGINGTVFPGSTRRRSTRSPRTSARARSTSPCRLASPLASSDRCPDEGDSRLLQRAGENDRQDAKVAKIRRDLKCSHSSSTWRSWRLGG